MRRRPPPSRWPSVITATVMLYFSVVGGASGILIAVLILHEIRPDHPFYVGVKSFLHSLFG